MLLDNTNYSKDIKEKLLENGYLLGNNINLWIMITWKIKLIEVLKM